jgi:hypothetical protein
MAILESGAVALIVVICAVFSIWRLLSVRLRLRTLGALSWLPVSVGGGLIATLRRRTLAGLSGGCGACRHATHTVSANVQFLNRKPDAPRR